MLWRWKKILLVASLGAVFLGALGFIYVSAILYRASTADADHVLEIPRGAGSYAISKQLSQIGLKHPPIVYRLEAWRRGQAYRPKAGEYRFSADGNLAAAMDILHEGQAVQHNITIAEGLTSREIVGLLRGDARLSGAIATIPPEGSLLPETYAFLRHTARADLISRMQSAQEIALAELWATRPQRHKGHKGHILKNLREAIILASIVEKETALDGERGLVAQVFLNRLEAGMRLQSDPTTHYALARDGVAVKTLSRADLRYDSPWNTYQYKGLPPTPISNPGVASVQAVLTPPDGDYLYFVADGKGGHRFAKTYDEHKANIKRWKQNTDGVE